MQVATYGKLEELYECCTSCLGEFAAFKTIYIRTQFVTTYLSTYKNPHYTLEIVKFDHIPSPWIEIEDSPS